MSTDPYESLPPWKRPVEYNGGPETDTPSRPADVEDADPSPTEEFGIDDDDEIEDEDWTGELGV